MPDSVHDHVMTQGDGLEARGAFLEAFDHFRANSRGNPLLRYRALRALMNSGAYKFAEDLLNSWRWTEPAAIAQAVAGMSEPLKSYTLEHLLALGGRIAKEKAFRAQRHDMPDHARRGAEWYRAASVMSGRAYPAINAASMAIIAGDRELARRLAFEALERTRRNPAEDTEYFRVATAAEAMIILGQMDRAGRTVRRAVDCGPAPVQRASTIRQLKLLSTVLPVRPEWLEMLRPRPVVCYVGHAGSWARAQRDLCPHIENALASIVPSSCYGALMAGADLVIAEAAIRAGIEVNVILPSNVDNFYEKSVRPWGAEWKAAFDRVLAAASSVRICGGDATRKIWIRLAGNYALGLARLRAQRLETQAILLACSDGAAAEPGIVGTASAIDKWVRTGGGVHPVKWQREPASPRADSTARAEGAPMRMAAFLFADTTGFGHLTDAAVERFFGTVIARLANVWGEAGLEPLHANSWGDAIYLAFATPREAAECALLLQEAFSGIDLAAEQLPADLRMRIGGHYGPALEVMDPIIGKRGVTGTQVTTAARIEPVTPPGEIYVTEPFSATLAIEAPDEYVCEYVGERDVAKEHGRMRLFRLRRG